MRKALVFAAILAASPAGAMADAATVPMKDKGADTFYVDVHVEGVGNIDYLVDTGAGYMTINEDTLAVLQARGKATYVRRLRGILADGSTLVVPVYRIDSINIGGVCRIDEVEAAVFPGASRSLLGLSALRRAAPLMFSIEPPILQMSNCTATAAPPADAQGARHDKASSVPPASELVRAGE
ncbi:MAG: retroviral-like aspartic protease family protein [Gammaproteobacteria bacterium]